MPSRKSVPLIKEHFYHIYNRVAKGLRLFYDDNDYIYYLKLWREVDFLPSARLLAYCLMPTHYHLLVQIIDEKLFPRKMSYFFNTYLHNLKVRHHLQGPFFPQRYKAKYITDNHYLMAVCCYIHLNPVEAGLVERIEDWPYSNYLEFINKRNGVLLDRELHNEFIESPEEYEKFINERYDEDQIEGFI